MCVDTHPGVTWLIHRYMVHPYVTWLIHMRTVASRTGILHMYKCIYMTNPYVLSLIHVWHDSCVCDMTHSLPCDAASCVHSWHDSLICDMTHELSWHESLIYHMSLWLMQQILCLSSMQQILCLSSMQQRLFDMWHDSWALMTWVTWVFYMSKTHMLHIKESLLHTRKTQYLLHTRKTLYLLHEWYVKDSCSKYSVFLVCSKYCVFLVCRNDSLICDMTHGLSWHDFLICDTAHGGDQTSNIWISRSLQKSC